MRTDVEHVRLILGGVVSAIDSAVVHELDSIPSLTVSATSHCTVQAQDVSTVTVDTSCAYTLQDVRLFLKRVFLGRQN